MTWNRSFSGSKEEVIQALTQADEVPAQAKDAAKAVVDSFKGDRKFTVHSIGHHSKDSYSNALEVSAEAIEPDAGAEQ